MTATGRWIALMIAVGVTCLAAGGCASVAEQERPGDPEELQQQARSFHTDLRWARYEHASEVVHPAWRPTFEGIYEERGDDYEIVEMDLKSVNMVDEGFTAHIEVEQQWMELPSTVVQTERFVERWVHEDDRWLIRERITRDEFRDQGEVFASAESEKDDQKSTDR